MPTTTTYSLVFYACAIPGLGSRAVKRLNKGDSRTSFDGILNAEAVRLDGPEEFHHLSRTFFKGEGAFGAVLVEGSDGSRRFPRSSDFILPAPSLPVAPVAPAVTPADVVSVSPLGATGGDLLLIARIRSMVAANPKLRSADVAVSLGITVQEVKDAVQAEGSGVKIGGFGILALVQAQPSILD